MSARLVIHLKILLVIIPHCIRVQFVDFEPGRLRRSRSVLFACQIVSETVHFPSAFGNLPVKHPVTILAAEVDDILFRYCIPSFRSRVEVANVCVGKESGLFRVYVDLGNGMQTNFRVAQPVSFLFCAYAYVSCRNRLDVKGIYGSGTRRKLFQYAAVADSVIAAFHLPVPSVALYASSCQCQCLDLSRGAKVKHYARVSVRSRSNLAGDVSVPVGQQFCPAVGTATHGWCQFVHCQLVFRHPNRHDSNVTIVGIPLRVIRVATYVEEFATTVGRSIDGPAVALTALDEGFFPDQLLHCLVLAHPGASGNAPARRTCYRDFQSQRVC